MHASSPSQTQGPGQCCCVVQEGDHRAQEVCTAKMSDTYSGRMMDGRYLEKVLKVMGCKLLHLGCIVGKPANSILPKWGDKTEPKITMAH